MVVDEKINANECQEEKENVPFHVSMNADNLTMYKDYWLKALSNLNESVMCYNDTKILDYFSNKAPLKTIKKPNSLLSAELNPTVAAAVSNGQKMIDQNLKLPKSFTETTKREICVTSSAADIKKLKSLTGLQVDPLKSSHNSEMGSSIVIAFRSTNRFSHIQLRVIIPVCYRKNIRISLKSSTGCRITEQKAHQFVLTLAKSSSSTASLQFKLMNDSPCGSINVELDVFHPHKMKMVLPLIVNDTLSPSANSKREINSHHPKANSNSILSPITKKSSPLPLAKHLSSPSKCSDLVKASTDQIIWLAGGMQNPTRKQFNLKSVSNERLTLKLKINSPPNVFFKVCLFFFLCFICLYVISLLFYNYFPVRRRR